MIYHFFQDIFTRWREDWLANKALFWSELLGVICSVVGSLDMCDQKSGHSDVSMFVFWLMGSVLLTTSNFIRRNFWIVLLMVFYSVCDTCGLVKFVI